MMVDSQHFAVKEIGAMHDQVARDFLEKQQQKEAVAQRTAGAQRRLQELLAQHARSDELAAERERAAEQGQRRDSLLADVRAHLDRFEGAVGALEQNDSFDMLHLGVDKGLFEHALEHFANFERSLGAEEATVA